MVVSLFYPCFLILCSVLATMGAAENWFVAVHAMQNYKVGSKFDFYAHYTFLKSITLLIKNEHYCVGGQKFGLVRTSLKEN